MWLRDNMLAQRMAIADRLVALAREILTVPSMKVIEVHMTDGHLDTRYSLQCSSYTV